MPRFSIKDLVLSTALVACGFAALVWPLPRFAFPIAFGIVHLVKWFGSFAMIGAGLIAPFHEMKLGAGFGAVAALLIMLLFLAVAFLAQHFSH